MALRLQLPCLGPVIGIESISHLAQETFIDVITVATEVEGAQSSILLCRQHVEECARAHCAYAIARQIEGSERRIRLQGGRKRSRPASATAWPRSVVFARSSSVAVVFVASSLANKMAAASSILLNDGVAASPSIFGGGSESGRAAQCVDV